MLTNQIFSVALGIKDPWFVEEINLDDDAKRLVELSRSRGGVSYRLISSIK